MNDQRSSRPSFFVAWLAVCSSVCSSALARGRGMPPKLRTVWGLCPERETHPQWAQLTVDALTPWLTNLRNLSNGSEPLTLNLWCDNVGLGAEMFALKEVERALIDALNAHVQFRLYCACERNHQVKQFISKNHQPTLITTDVTKRVWDTGGFLSRRGNAKGKGKGTKPATMPSAGLDMYIGHWPRRPGVRPSGRQRPRVDVQADVDAMAMSIAFMRPGLFLMIEGVDWPTDDWDHGVGAVRVAAPSYDTVVLQSIPAELAGYPVVKHGKLLLGVRADMRVSHLFQPLMEALPRVALPPGGFRATLGMNVGANWERVHCLPTEEETALLKGCTCSLDVWTRCPRHPCLCNDCKALIGKKRNRTCTWKEQASEYFQRDGELPYGNAKEPLISYVQAAELQGLAAPMAPRERWMLNVAACQATPLADTVLIVDTDVSIDANFVTRDGIPSLMSSTSKLWSLRDGVYLSPLQVSELMGFRGADFDAIWC